VTNSAAMPWYDGPPLLSHLETVHIASDRNLADMRFPVQYVLRPNLNFRGEISFILADPDATRFFFGVSLPINKKK